MKSVIVIAFLITFSFLAVSVKAQSRSKEISSTGKDECCKKTSNKKSTSMNTPKMISTVKKGKVVACKLTSQELQKRKNEIITLLKPHIVERKELTNGYKFTFKGADNMLDDLVSFIKTERACCSFFTFELSIKDIETNIQLTITGPEGAKKFIDTEIEL